MLIFSLLSISSTTNTRILLNLIQSNCAILVQSAEVQRDVAQLGSAPALGAGCRQFSTLTN